MKREAGFTLVELLTVVAIIGVLTGIVALNLMGDIKRNKLKEATTQFYSDLKKCRVDAMTRPSRGYGFNFNDATSYRTFEFNDANNDYVYTAGEELNPVAVTVPNGVQVSIDSGTLTTPLLFDHRGWLRSANWGAAGGATYLFTLDGVTTVRCVVLSTSRIRQGVWNAPNCN